MSEEELSFLVVIYAIPFAVLIALFTVTGMFASYMFCHFFLQLSDFAICLCILINTLFSFSVGLLIACKLAFTIRITLKRPSLEKEEFNDVTNPIEKREFLNKHKKFILSEEDVQKLMYWNNLKRRK